MGSLEEVAIKIEKAHRTDYDDIINWLSNDGQRSKSMYKNVASIIQEPFTLQKQSDKLDTSDWANADDLRDLRNEAQDLDIELGEVRVGTINEIQQKLNTVEKLETTQIGLREQLISEREVLKQELSEATTPEEVKIAKRELGELSPQSLGGIKSGETRRVPKAFSTLF